MKEKDNDIKVLGFKTCLINGIFEQKSVFNAMACFFSTTSYSFSSFCSSFLFIFLHFFATFVLVTLLSINRVSQMRRQTKIQVVFDFQRSSNRKRL